MQWNSLTNLNIAKMSQLHMYKERKCTDNLHSAGSLGRPFPMLKYIFQIKYMQAILSNSTRKLLQFEITKMLIAVLPKIYGYLL